MMRAGGWPSTPLNGKGCLMPELFFPFTSQVWASPYSTYSYNADAKESGHFNGSEGQTFYAPEAGTLFPLEDGGFILTVHDADNDREWIGSYISGLAKVFAPNEAVKAGQPLGKLSSALDLVLKVTKKGTDLFEFIDPVEMLQGAGAVFADMARGASSLVSPAATALATVPAGSPAVAMLPYGGIPTPATAIEIYKTCPPPGFNYWHMAAAAGVGGVFAFMMARGMRGR